MRKPIGAIVAAVLVTVLGGCSSPNLHQEYRERLDRVAGFLEAGQLREATVDATQLVADLNGNEADFGLQRFYAHAALATAHCDAAMEQPFLNGATNGASAGTTASVAERKRAHMVAAVAQIEFCRQMQVSFGSSWPPASAASPPEVEGVVPIPPGLYGTVAASHGPRAVVDRLFARELAIVVRLGFTRRLSALLESGSRVFGDMMDAESVAAIVADDLALSPNEQFWVLYGIHVYIRDGLMEEREATAAMRFAFLGYRIKGTDSNPRSKERQAAAEMRRWVEENPDWDFRHEDLENAELTDLMTTTDEFIRDKLRYIDAGAVRKTPSS